MHDLPELITAAGVAIAAILTAWQARTAVQVKDLKKKVAELEDDHAQLNEKFRLAVAHIREWMGWWRSNHPDTTPPRMPEELKDEI